MDDDEIGCAVASLNEAIKDTTIEVPAEAPPDVEMAGEQNQPMQIESDSEEEDSYDSAGRIIRDSIHRTEVHRVGKPIHDQTHFKAQVENLDASESSGRDDAGEEGEDSQEESLLSGGIQDESMSERDPEEEDDEDSSLYNSDQDEQESPETDTHVKHSHVKRAAKS